MRYRDEGKELTSAAHALGVALQREREKHLLCPVTGYPQEQANAEAWGYVVVGYSLIEQAFKLLIWLERKKAAGFGHGLLGLFRKISASRQKELQDYYASYLNCRRGQGFFPHAAYDGLETFLKNLDGRKGDKGQSLGSIDWRYHMIERLPEQTDLLIPLSTVTADALHEVAGAAIDFLRGFPSSGPGNYVHRKHSDACGLVGTGAGEIWTEQDGLHLLCGPDHEGNYGYLLVESAGTTVEFGPLPPLSECTAFDLRGHVDDLLRQQEYEAALQRNRQ